MTRRLSSVASLVLAAVLTVVCPIPGPAGAAASDGVSLTVAAPRADKLVKGVWTRIPVTVTNTSAVPAEDVQVVGAATGVRVRKLSVGALAAGSSRTGLVWAKLRVASATLRLDATELGTTLARTSVRLASRPAPLPPRATGWSGDGVSFQLLGGQVNVLKGKVPTSCGTKDLVYPAIAVPRNNEVYGSAAGADGSQMVLELDFLSTTRGVGSLTWTYDGGCRGVVRFTVHANV
ncbi:hypothetical protein L2K70_03860 [Nocardioides KLBMP 9356]|uniref:Uncharacterized protein n=1 Tax=Nocardioides potassii TaxID=2911371 RepID=A0ABS9H947_9ACTN|nr:hypothetical protein [Nocardioides potassii]MCF6376730.1 hypothetical protein [Nocardioides potassii]